MRNVSIRVQIGQMAVAVLANRSLVGTVLIPPLGLVLVIQFVETPLLLVMKIVKEQSQGVLVVKRIMDGIVTVSYTHLTLPTTPYV